MFACMHVCMCARLYVRVYVCARDACACACACACVCVCAYTAEQLAGLPRLRKMLDRMSDLSNFAGERHNATMAVHTSLDKLQLNEESLRLACGGLSGDDVRRPTLATLTFAKRITSRREWFEENANHIANPMGVTVTVNRATGHFGRTGHNGVCLVGMPTARLLL